MERLLTILVVAFFFVTTTINAEEEGSHPTDQFLSPTLPCNSWEVIAHNLVNGYSEVPVADGSGALTMQDSTVFGGETVIFINPDTGSYTLVFREEESGIACILAAGEQFGPADPQKYLEIMGAVTL
jgi:hypothetical protein